MSRTVVNLPPIYSAPAYNNRVTKPWQVYHNAMFTAHKEIVPTYPSTPTGPTPPPPSPVGKMYSYTTAERDAWIGVEDGVHLLNTTTNKMNYRANGAWVEV